MTVVLAFVLFPVPAETNCLHVVLFIFDDHVVHNDARKHDVVDGVKVPLPDKTFNDRPLSLQDAKRPLDIFPCSFLHLCEVLLLLPLWQVNGVNKTTPLWVNAISEQIETRVIVAVQLKAHVLPGASQYVCHQRGPVMNIDVIVAAGQAEECVPYSGGLVRYGLKDDAANAVLVLELALTCSGALLPRPMHAVKAAEHTREAACRIDFNLLSEVCKCRVPQICVSKTSTDGIHPMPHGHESGGLIYANVLITSICRESICKHSYCSSIFLQT